MLARSAAADPPEAVSPARLDAEARAALGRARLRVVLESSGATNAAGAGRLLEQAASSCLAAAGLPIGEGGDGVLALRAVFDPALQVAPGLSVVRGHLSVALHGAGGESVTGEEGAAKGGGATPELARAESERKLAAEVLPGAVDKALDLLGWPGLRKCAR